MNVISKLIDSLDNLSISILNFTLSFRSFLRSSQVFLHVYETHVIPSTFPNIMTCQWGGPEGIGPGCQSKRPKLSLLTHILVIQLFIILFY